MSNVKSWAYQWAKKHKELTDKLARLEKRKAEGWGYRRVYRKKRKVPAHTVRGHYAMVPVKRR